MASKGEERLSKTEDLVEDQLESIEETIAKVELMLAPYDNIKERLERLRRARSALLGGSHSTGGGTTRVRREDIRDFLIENPGATPGMIAEGLGSTQNNISTHLHRGKEERFLTDGHSHWWVRDPKSGINTYQDIKDQEEHG